VSSLTPSIVNHSLLCEILDKKKRITPRYLQLAIANDEELSHLIPKTFIPQGGVLPYIQPALRKQKKGKVPYTQVAKGPLKTVKYQRKAVGKTGKMRMEVVLSGKKGRDLEESYPGMWISCFSHCMLTLL